MHTDTMLERARAIIEEHKVRYPGSDIHSIEITVEPMEGAPDRVGVELRSAHFSMPFRYVAPGFQERECSCRLPAGPGSMCYVCGGNHTVKP
jgi:hypothetical protein